MRRLKREPVEPHGLLRERDKGSDGACTWDQYVNWRQIVTVWFGMGVWFRMGRPPAEPPQRAPLGLAPLTQGAPLGPRLKWRDA